MNPKLSKQLTRCTEPAIWLQCLQRDQLITAVDQSWSGRWIQPGQIVSKAAPPCRQFQDHGLRVGQPELRGTEPWSPLLIGRRPEANAASWTLAACPSATLICAGQAGRDGLEALHAAVWVVAQLTTETAVDHKPHPFQGDGTFGNGAGQEHLSGVLVITSIQGLALFLQRQLAMQARHTPIPKAG